MDSVWYVCPRCGGEVIHGPEDFYCEHVFCGWESDEAPRVTVQRVTCHASAEDFTGERCPTCGVNLYDWLLTVDEPDGEPPHSAQDGLGGHALEHDEVDDHGGVQGS